MNETPENPQFFQQEVQLMQGVLFDLEALGVSGTKAPYGLKSRRLTWLDIMPS